GQGVWQLRRLSCRNVKLASPYLIAPVIGGVAGVRVAERRLGDESVAELASGDWQSVHSGSAGESAIAEGPAGAGPTRRIRRNQNVVWEFEVKVVQNDR